MYGSYATKQYSLNSNEYDGGAEARAAAAAARASAAAAAADTTASARRKRLMVYGAEVSTMLCGLGILIALIILDALGSDNPAYLVSFIGALLTAFSSLFTIIFTRLGQFPRVAYCAGAGLVANLLIFALLGAAETVNSYFPVPVIVLLILSNEVDLAYVIYYARQQPASGGPPVSPPRSPPSYDDIEALEADDEYLLLPPPSPPPGPPEATPGGPPTPQAQGTQDDDAATRLPDAQDPGPPVMSIVVDPVGRQGSRSPPKKKMTKEELEAKQGPKGSEKLASKGSANPFVAAKANKSTTGDKSKLEKDAEKMEAVAKLKKADKKIAEIATEKAKFQKQKEEGTITTEKADEELEKLEEELGKQETIQKNEQAIVDKYTKPAAADAPAAEKDILAKLGEGVQAGSKAVAMGTIKGIGKVAMGTEKSAEVLAHSTCMSSPLLGPPALVASRLTSPHSASPRVAMPCPTHGALRLDAASLILLNPSPSLTCLHLLLSSLARSGWPTRWEVATSW